MSVLELASFTLTDKPELTPVSSASFATRPQCCGGAQAVELDR